MNDIDEIDGKFIAYRVNNFGGQHSATIVEEGFSGSLPVKIQDSNGTTAVNGE